QQALARVAVDDAGELLHGIALLVGELARDVDHEAVVDVAARLAAGHRRRALAAQPLDGAVTGAAGHAQLLRAVQRRHLDVGAAQRLGDRDRHLDLEVVALAPEHRRLADVRDDVEVAGRAAAQPGLALAGEPDPRALLDARRDVHAVLLELAQPALAVAGRAGILDHGAGAAAARARPRDREHALTLRLHAATLADRADDRRRSGPRAGAAAGVARHVRRHRHGDLRARDGLLERQRDRGL